LLFLVVLPNLSQDYFRFIWDGHLILENINPYLVAKDLINQSSFAIPNGHALYNGMGSLSAGHYQLSSVNQFFFAVAFFSQQSILSGNRYATNYYCCRYWNFYFGGKLLANLGMENIVFLVLTQSISTY
jgi:hypothetical protein